MRVRFIQQGKQATKKNVRTIDSYIIDKFHSTHDRVWVDEGLMVHPGEIAYLAKFSEAKEMVIFGDTKQIPFINRVADFTIPQDLVKLVVNNVEQRNTTLRCPMDVTSFLNEVYNRTVRTTSNVYNSMKCVLLPGQGYMNPVNFNLFRDKVLTFTQNEKLELIQRGFKANTVHEVQGETFHSVALIRLQYQNIPLIEDGSEHITVALSRHTNSLVYYTVKADVIYARIEALQQVSNVILRNFCDLGFKK